MRLGLSPPLAKSWILALGDPVQEGSATSGGDLCVSSFFWGKKYPGAPLNGWSDIATFHGFEQKWNVFCQLVSDRGNKFIDQLRSRSRMRKRQMTHRNLQVSWVLAFFGMIVMSGGGLCVRVCVCVWVCVSMLITKTSWRPTYASQNTRGLQFYARGWKGEFENLFIWQQKTHCEQKQGKT